MRVAGLVAVVAAVVAVFAIYTWGWRGPADPDRTAMAGVAREVKASLGYRLEGAHRLNGHAWFARFLRQNGSRVCVIIELDRFKFVKLSDNGGPDWQGVAQARCDT